MQSHSAVLYRVIRPKVPNAKKPRTMLKSDQNCTMPPTTRVVTHPPPNTPPHTARAPL